MSPAPNWPPYWNPKNETLARGELRQLQLIKLQRTVARAYEQSPFHRRLYDQAKVKPSDIKTLDDLRRLPFMTREDWMACQAEKPMFGDLITRPQSEAIRYHLTSGTSGRQPLRVLDSRKDWAWIGESWCYGFWGFGVRPTDTVFFAFSYGSFIGFWGAHYCCEKMGCLVLPSGNMTTEARVKQLVEMGATTVCATPTYALRMAQEAQAIQAFGVEWLHKQLCDRQRHDRRLDTVLAIFQRYGLIEDEHDLSELSIQLPLPDTLADANERQAKLVRDQRKLYALVEYVQSADRRQFLREYFGTHAQHEK